VEINGDLLLPQVCGFVGRLFDVNILVLRNFSKDELHLNSVFFR